MLAPSFGKIIRNGEDATFTGGIHNTGKRRVMKQTNRQTNEDTNCRDRHCTPTPPAPMHTVGSLDLPHLSEKDSTIFSVLFDPESTPSANASTHQYIHIDSGLPSDPHIPAELLPGIKQREVRAVLEAEAAISLPRADHAEHPLDLHTLEHALEMLNKLIEDFPRYASAYNNRAQVRRLLLHRKRPVAGEDTDSAHQEQHQLVPTSPSVRTVESDLHSAITLASGGGGGGANHPLATTPLERVSPAQAKVLQSAYTQLATLYLAFYRAAQSADAEGQCPAMSMENWEERASHYFRLAGRYGSELGRAMAVRTNPYAKMCAGMVKEVMKREVQGVGINFDCV